MSYSKEILKKIFLHQCLIKLYNEYSHKRLIEKMPNFNRLIHMNSEELNKEGVKAYDCCNLIVILEPEDQTKLANIINETIESDFKDKKFKIIPLKQN